MYALKKPLLVMLCLAISVAGFPMMAAAKSQCPMAAKMQVQQMHMQGVKDCKGCARTADKQDQQKKNGRCGDMACAAKCSFMSNLGPAVQGNQVASRSPIGGVERFYGSGHVLAFHLLNTQDRPPKYLS